MHELKSYAVHQLGKKNLKYTEGKTESFLWKNSHMVNISHDLFPCWILTTEYMYIHTHTCVCMYVCGWFQMPTKLIYRCVANTTLSCSNVVGPLEEIQMFGHQITHILPTVSGQPQVSSCRFTLTFKHHNICNLFKINLIRWLSRSCNMSHLTILVWRRLYWWRSVCLWKPPNLTSLGAPARDH